MTQIPAVSIPSPVANRSDDTRNPELWAAAEALEASFLSTMLQSAGLGEARDSFGGGVGEEQFASMLAMEQARAMTRSGGIGLAESIYTALTRQDPDS